MKKRERADVLLVRRGLVQSREQGRAAILAGEVTADGVPVVKAGQQVLEDAQLAVATGSPYVSRGGIKLAHALDTFGLDVTGLVAIDVGASTGGFTDCLLQRGVAKVVAIDVGYGQLAWKLRTDPRVVVMERTNVRHLKPDAVDIKGDIITVDVSFIPVRKIFDVLLGLLAPEGVMLVLVKPQFEGERRLVGKGGIVRGEDAHRRILGGFTRFVMDAGLVVRNLAYSPITGADGNIEFWLYAERRRPGGVTEGDPAEMADRTVGEAHAALASSSE